MDRFFHLLEKREKEFILKEAQYLCDDKTLLLHFNPITSIYCGIEEERVDEVRDKFIQSLEEKLKDKSDLQDIAEAITQIYSQEPFFLLLPADSRPRRNRSRLLDHGLLTSAIAVCLTIELLEKLSPDKIAGLKGIDKSDLVQLARISSLLHDIGKFPIKSLGYHPQKGAGLANDLFLSTKMPTKFREILINGIRRHHGAREYVFHPETILEEIICHADSASTSDRLPKLEEDIDKPLEELKKESGVPVDWEDFISFYGQELDFLTRHFGEGAKPISLISIDADKIKTYVFETSRLPEIRGASHLLEELNKPEFYKSCSSLPDECIIFSGGGSALLITPASQAQRIKLEIEKRFVEKALSTTVTCTSKDINLLELRYGIAPGRMWLEPLASKWKEWSPEAWDKLTKYFNFDLSKGVKSTDNLSQLLKTKGFGEIVRDLRIRLRMEKGNKPSFPFFEALPLFKRCSSCQLRGAVERKLFEGEEHYLCPICYKKRSIAEKLEKERYRKFVEKAPEWREARLPQKLEEIAGRERRIHRCGLRRC